MRAWLVAFMVVMSASSASSAEIRVMAAGSLKDAFTAIFADYAKLHGGSFSPVWGPVPAVRAGSQETRKGRMTSGSEL